MSEVHTTIIDLDAGAVFSGTPSGRIIKGFDKPCAQIGRAHV